MLHLSLYVAKILCRDAIWTKDNTACNWLGFGGKVDIDSGRSQYGSIGIDVYGGALGVIYFLMKVYKIKPEPIIKSTLEGALKFCWQQQHTLNNSHYISYFSGLGGYALILVQASQILQNSLYLEQSEAIFNQISQKEGLSYFGDFISGGAGFISMAVNSKNSPLSDSVKKLIEAYSLQILENKHIEANMCSWNTTAKAQKHLTGLAHGNSGFMLALASWYKITNNNNYLKTLLQAWNYEDAQKDVQKCNWPDYRIFDNEDARKTNFMNAWCHGAAGISLSRLKLLEILETGNTNIYNRIEKDLEFAYPTLLKILDNPPPPHIAGMSYCHGIAGNLSVLYLAAKFLKDEQTLQKISNLASQIGEVLKRNSYLVYCGTPDGAYTPSLMLGLAGVGMFYLTIESDLNVLELP